MKSCFPLILFIMFLHPETSLFSQDVQVKASRQSSLDAFSKGDYEKAFGEFSELLKSYPKDQLYKYYSGVCLIKLNRNFEEAARLLTESRAGATVARIVPADALYWLGKAQQLSGKYAEAIDSYNTFTEQSGRKAARDLGVPELIQQCNGKKGESTAYGPITKHPVIEPAIEASTPKEKVIQPEIPATIAPKTSDTLPDNYDRILSEALIYQVKTDSLYKIAEDLKKNPAKPDNKTKADLKLKIVETENLAASFQKQADQKYAEAQASMNAKPFAPGIPSAQKTLPSIDSSAVEHKNITKTVAGSEKNQSAIKDSLNFTKRSTPEVTVIKSAEVRDTATKQVIRSYTSRVQNRPASVYSVFEPSAVGVPVKDEKIKINPVVPQGLIYRIQVAVFRKPMAPSYFKGIAPIYGFKVSGTDKINYCAGMFRRLSDAGRALAVVRKKGFKDAFIISLYYGKAVSQERAALLEKEWGKKPFSAIVQNPGAAPSDTVPPALSFRVEVMRSAKPVKDDLLEGMRRMAGSRGLDTESMKDGSEVYLIGKFITYKSAEEYADLLIRNGYRDARVVARLGKKEIPVETARDLFEKLE